MEHALHFEKFCNEFFLNLKDIVRKQQKEGSEPSEVLFFHKCVSFIFKHLVL